MNPTNIEIEPQFSRDGYFILKGFLEPPVVEGVRKEMESCVDRLAEDFQRCGELDDLYQEEPFETRYLKLYENRLEEATAGFRHELHLPGMFPLFFHSRLLDLIEGILGPEIRLYPNYTVRPKLPDHLLTLILWHQDGAYTELWHRVEDRPVTRLRMVNVWTPLVAATAENGCMQFIPGTHLMNVLPHEEKEHYLEIPKDTLRTLDAPVTIELEPGDVVVFSNMLCHRGLPNRTRTVRWSCDWRYQDATQSTLRTDQGHIARSRRHPEEVVQTAQQWANRQFA